MQNFNFKHNITFQYSLINSIALQNSLLEKQIQELNYQLEDDQRSYEAALNDRDAQIRKMREECQALMVELQMLLDTKQVRLRVHVISTATLYCSPLISRGFFHIRPRMNYTKMYCADNTNTSILKLWMPTLCLPQQTLVQRNTSTISVLVCTGATFIQVRNSPGTLGSIGDTCSALLMLTELEGPCRTHSDDYFVQ